MDASATGWLAAGLAVGGGAAAAVRFIVARTRSRAPSTMVTESWSLADLAEPTLVVRSLEGLELPPGARVLASGPVDPAIQARCPVRRVPGVAAEYACDSRGRALLFLGGARPGSLALETVDPAIVARLAREAAALWEHATPYVERAPIGDLAGRAGVPVETSGHVADSVPYRGRYLLRLHDGADAIGVLVDRDPASLRGERVHVRGTLVKDGRGYAAIEAMDLRRIV